MNCGAYFSRWTVREGLSSCLALLVSRFIHAKILNFSPAGLQEPPSVGNHHHSCSKGLWCSCAGLQDLGSLGRTYIQKSSRVYFIRPFLWFSFLALVLKIKT